MRGTRWRAFPPPDVPTVDDYLELTGLPSGGAVRVSLGLVSDIGDVEHFLDFAERTYRDREPSYRGLAPRLRCLPVRTGSPFGPAEMQKRAASIRGSIRHRAAADAAAAPPASASPTAAGRSW